MKIETKYLVAIIISVILGASVLGYGYLDYRYKKDALEQQVKMTEQVRVEKENKERSESNSNSAKQIQLEACLDEVNQRISKVFEDSKYKNISTEGAKIIVDLVQKQKDECFKKYPQ